MIHDIVQWRDGSKLSFTKIAKKINEKYGMNLSRSAVNHRYLRHSEEVSTSTHTVPARYSLTTEINLSGNVIVIADTHIPFCHPGYLDFILRTRDEYNCDVAIHIGDFCDQHALSFWDTDPDGMSAGFEHESALEAAQKWYNEFPEMHVCIGNHDGRHYRKAMKSGISQAYLRTHEEVWEAPRSWKWGLKWRLNDVTYIHGTGTTGKLAALNRSNDLGGSLVMGHTHTFGGVVWTYRDDKRYFGMNVGCGIDEGMYAMAYANAFRYNPTLGCGVILSDGEFPIFVPF